MADSRPNRDKFYGTTEWFKARSQVLKRDGYRCVICEADVHGKGKARVDHIKPKKEYPELALELANLRTLCLSCDAKRHADKGRAALIKRGITPRSAERQETGPDGFPVDSESSFYN